MEIRSEEDVRRSERVEIRCTKKEKDVLSELSKNLGMTKTDTIMAAIYSLYRSKN